MYTMEGLEYACAGDVGCAAVYLLIIQSYQGQQKGPDPLSLPRQTGAWEAKQHTWEQQDRPLPGSAAIAAHGSTPATTKYPSMFQCL